MDWLYGKILNAVTSRTGKLSAATLIGMIAFGAHGYKDESARNSGIPWLIAGALIGFVAGILLLLHDYGRQPVATTSGGQPGRRWPRWAVPLLAAGLLMFGLIAHFVWTIVSLTW